MNKVFIIIGGSNFYHRLKKANLHSLLSFDYSSFASFTFLYFLALIFFATPVFGAIEPPYKEIEYCYRIDNISAFPDFVVIARFPSPEAGYADPIQLKKDECYAHNTRDEIVAVRRERFQVSNMEVGILNSGVRTPVSPVKIYDPQDPRKKIEDTFTIDALDDQTFSLRLAKKIVERDNGSVEEKVYATGEDGLADPPGPGYEYTDAPIAIVENPEKMNRAWYLQDWAKGLFVLGLLVVFGIIAWLSLHHCSRV